MSDSTGADDGGKFHGTAMVRGGVSSLDSSRDSRRDLARTVLKFLAATTVTTLAYMLTVALIQYGPDFLTSPLGFTGFDDFLELGRWFVWMVTPVLPAAYVYHGLPTESVDRYHRLGKVFAMFIPINLTLSFLFMLYNFVLIPDPASVSFLNLVVYFSLASAGLPGPYFGALIGMRWSK